MGTLRTNEDLLKTLQVDGKLPNTLQKNQGLRALMNQAGLNGGKVISITYNQTFDSFAYLLGSEVNYITDTDIVKAYEDMEEVQNMPAYPYDGRMVIKLS